MKLPSSSSSSSSSSTRSMSSACSSSVSTDQNMWNQKSNSTVCCLARVLRRILCSRALPTHPFDHISESGEKDQVMGKTEETVNAPLVARLMGLPTVPNKSPCPVSISRSMNLRECPEEDCDLKRQQGKHNNLNSKLSVSNMPVFIELENEEFIVFRFGKKKPRKSLGLKKNDSMENKGNGTSMEAQVASKKKRHLESDNSFEDSSPVSVFDFDQFTTACQEVSKTGEESGAEDSNNENNAHQLAGGHEDLVETSSIREKESWRGSESEESICRLIEEEVKQLSWFSSKRFDIEEVAADCGMALLDTLLDEIILQSP